MSPPQCKHTDRPCAGRTCPHLLESKDPAHVQRFSGVGRSYDLLCGVCCHEPITTEPAVVNVCGECFRAIEENGSWEGILGQPEILTRPSSLSFEHEIIDLAELVDANILDIRPIDRSAGIWLACTETGTLIEINSAQRSGRVVAQVPHEALDFDGPNIRKRKTNAWPKGSACTLHVSPNGDLAAVANRYGDKGVVLDLATGRTTMKLLRDNYHADVSCFPLAFAEWDDRLSLIHGTAWNRIDVSDARTGELLTQRELTSFERGEPRPQHYLDYFHCQLLVSPSQQFVVDNGWVWHPVGVVVAWSIERWLRENAWESEDGASKKALCYRDYFWDGPLCWIDDQHLAVWGYGRDSEWLIPAVCIFDVRTGKQESWFPGPKGSLVFDQYLFSFDEKDGLSVWDVVIGERLLSEPGLCPAGYHAGAKSFLSILKDGKVQISRLVGQ